jgi:hypothetical protein
MSENDGKPTGTKPEEKLYRVEAVAVEEIWAETPEQAQAIALDLVETDAENRGFRERFSTRVELRDAQTEEGEAEAEELKDDERYSRSRGE